MSSIDSFLYPSPLDQLSKEVVAAKRIGDVSIPNPNDIDDWLAAALKSDGQAQTAIFVEALDYSQQLADQFKQVFFDIILKNIIEEYGSLDNLMERLVVQKQLDQIQKMVTLLQNLALLNSLSPEVVSRVLSYIKAQKDTPSSDLAESSKAPESMDEPFQDSLSSTAETERVQPRVFRQPQIESLTDLPHLPKFSWELTTDDPDNHDHILVWRYINHMSPGTAATDGHLSFRAATESSYEEIEAGRRSMQHIRQSMNELFLGQDSKAVARSYILSSGVNHDRTSPVLHTTYDHDNAVGVPGDGVVIEYSVPKQYILDHEDELHVTTGGETEIGFLYGLEQSMIKNVTWKDEAGKEVTEAAADIRARLDEAAQKRTALSPTFQF